MPPAARTGSPLLTFYTSNPGKVREVRQALQGAHWRVRWGRRGFLEPQADALETVVRAKLAQVPRRTGPILVEDSGLFVPSLGGFPGVYSAYVYRTLGPKGLLRLVDGKARRAEFRAVFGLRDARGRCFTFQGTCRGELAPSPRGAGGFGFDPVFVAQGTTWTFAQMSPEKKNALSHRGKALRALVRHLSR